MKSREDWVHLLWKVNKERRHDKRSEDDKRSGEGNSGLSPSSDSTHGPEKENQATPTILKPNSVEYFFHVAERCGTHCPDCLEPDSPWHSIRHWLGSSPNPEDWRPHLAFTWKGTKNLAYLRCIMNPWFPRMEQRPSLSFSPQYSCVFSWHISTYHLQLICHWGIWISSSFCL